MKIVRNFFKRYIHVIGLVGIVLLFGVMIILPSKISFTFPSILFSLVYIAFICASMYFLLTSYIKHMQKLKDKRLNKEYEEKLAKIPELRKVYPELCKIVLNETQKKNELVLKEFGTKISSKFSYNKNLEWLIPFTEALEYVKEKRIRGIPDTFIEASCLIYSMLKAPIITFDEYTDDIELILIRLNVELAFECALNLVMSPVTFKQECNMEWVECYHPKISITVPDGIIPGSPLEKRIQNNIILSYYYNSSYDIMLVADILHLIYLTNV